MSRIFTFFVLFVCSYHASAQQYAKMNMDLLGHWTTDSIPFNSSNNLYSSCWGYEQDGREYAIVGASHGTFIFEVTDPANIRYVDFIKSNIRRAIWREYKTYKNYLYCVSDDNGPNHLDIVDLSGLPEKVEVVYSGNDYLVKGHTIFIEKDLMYIGIRTSTSAYNSMTVFDLSEDPTKPKELRSLNQDYPEIGQVHDMFVRNDTVYASCGFGGLHMFTFDNERFHKIGEFTNYPTAGYNHSSILTPDGKTLIFTDEVPQTLPAKSLDVTDPSNPVLLSTFESYTKKATSHNPFLPNGVKDKFVMSSYTDGVIVYDYSDVSDIKITGYFDTFHQEDGEETTGDYNGVWSVYVNLPSKNIIAVDMTNGLFVIDPGTAYDELIGTHAVANITKELTVSPNPTTDKVAIELPRLVTNQKSFDVKVFNALGSLAMEKNITVDNNQLSLDVNTFAPGVYFVYFTADNTQFTAKIVKN